MTPETHMVAPGLSRADAEALASGSCGDPFRLLGPQPVDGGWVIRAIMPGAETVEIPVRPDVIDEFIAKLVSE